MKKNLKRILWMFGIVLVCIILYNMFLKRTPERIFKGFFDVSLDNFNYSVVTFEEQWCPNGDGYIYIVLKFRELTPQNIAYLKSIQAKPLPMKELETVVAEEFQRVKKGYYFYSPASERNKVDYMILLFNLETKEAIFYYTLS